MTKEEKLECLQECYRRAVSEGKAHNQTTFAKLVGVNRSVLSSAFHGKESCLTESFISRIQSAMSALEQAQSTKGVFVTRDSIHKAYSLMAQALSSMATAMDFIAKDFKLISNDTEEDCQNQETH